MGIVWLVTFVLYDLGFESDSGSCYGNVNQMFEYYLGFL